MYSFQGAPIVNKGYYDVPICNEFSNKEIRDKPTETNQYQINRRINVSMNNNKGEYKVYQDPTVPSPSLYLETDQPMSGYYYKDPMSLSFDGTVPLVKKKEQSSQYNYINSDLFPKNGVERFHGGGGHGGGGGGGHMGGGGGHEGGGGRGGYIGGGHGGMHSGHGGHGGNNHYLNTAMMPNINRNYWGGISSYNDFGTGYPYYEYTEPSYVNYVQPVREVIVEKPVYEEIKIEQIPSEEIKKDTKISKKISKKIIKEEKIENKKTFFTKKVLWIIVIILSIIIILFLIYFYRLHYMISKPKIIY
jgi:hypothetical protein